MTRSSSRKTRWSVLADFLSGCREMTETISAPFEARPLTAAGNQRAASPSGESVLTGLTLQGSADAVLLFRRMEMLGIDSEEIARTLRAQPFQEAPAPA